jgi:hypothetical protein
LSLSLLQLGSSFKTHRLINKDIHVVGITVTDIVNILVHLASR